MEFRTKVNITPSTDKISYKDPVMFIGSCFASEMGSRMKTGRMPVSINPYGPVFNPVSVSNTLDLITAARELTIDDLYNHSGTWLSFYHYTEFSSEDPAKVLEKINLATVKASEFLKKARFLFVTFGTARVYRLKQSGMIVSNCHKVPSENFVNELLTVDTITGLWSVQLDKLKSLYPELKVVFTISPVRHWKDGHYGNQVSKSTLFLAVNELLHHMPSPRYFPAYEIVMDELRDYRFYAEDMLHPSSPAIDYIWESFSGCFLEKKTMETWNEIAAISKAMNHRLNPDSSAGTRKFAETMLKQVDLLQVKNPEIDLSSERDYFDKILKK